MNAEARKEIERYCDYVEFRRHAPSLPAPQ